ncbi:MAG: hypothetical protein ACYCPQ_11080 [Elusimicrobiota bacterium]
MRTIRLLKILSAALVVAGSLHQISSAQQTTRSYGTGSGPITSPKIDCSGVLKNLVSAQTAAISHTAQLPADKAAYSNALANAQQAEAAYQSALASCQESGQTGCGGVAAARAALASAQAQVASTRAQMNADGAQSSNDGTQVNQNIALVNYCINSGGAGGLTGANLTPPANPVLTPHDKYLMEVAQNSTPTMLELGKIESAGPGSSVSLGAGGMMWVPTPGGKPDLSNVVVFYRQDPANPENLTSYATWSQMSAQEQQQVADIVQYSALSPAPKTPIPLAQMDAWANSIVAAGGGTSGGGSESAAPISSANPGSVASAQSPFGGPTPGGFQNGLAGIELGKLESGAGVGQFGLVSLGSNGFVFLPKNQATGQGDLSGAVYFSGDANSYTTWSQMTAAQQQQIMSQGLEYSYLLAPPGVNSASSGGGNAPNVNLQSGTGLPDNGAPLGQTSQ